MAPDDIKRGAEPDPAPRPFEAEVAKLLQLMVHSVYSEREIFLRELISNAADALDKLRYEAIARPELLAGDDELAITLTAEPATRTLTIADSGIGMSAAELAANLGTIAKSGTQAFMEAAKEKGGVSLIGQFGVGFYSAFMVADRVDVISRAAGSGEAAQWSSDGLGSYTVKAVDAALAPPRGTRIVLHLKEDAAEFLEPMRIEGIVRAYSDHIGHPIRLAIGSETTRQINSASAIWARPKTEITAEQYAEFAGHVTGSYSAPALTIHYRAEGRNEYTVLLVVPQERPFDLFDPERRGRQKLYVRRVFITDEAELLPAYLRFVRGVIDSEDMPLNLSREMLQHNPAVAQIRKAVTNRVISELKKYAESDAAAYGKLWDSFGPVLKEGVYEDHERRESLLEIARFRSTAADVTSLEDYIARMKPEQDAIYFLTAEDRAKAEASPQLEGFKARGLEVLLLTDPVDAFWTRLQPSFKDKPLRSVTQGAADLAKFTRVAAAGDVAAEAGAKAEGAELGTLLAAMKQALGSAVKDVRASERLTDSPVCLVADASGFDRTLEKLLSRNAASGVTLSAPVLEINPSHPLITALAARAKSEGASAGIADAAQLLLDQAHVLEGEPVADPAGFARRLSALMVKGLA